MGFRTLVGLLLLINLAFLSYDHFQGGSIALDLVTHAKRLDAHKLQADVQSALHQIKTASPEKIAAHINTVFAQLKDIQSPKDILTLLREKTAPATVGASDIEHGVVVLTQDNFHAVVDGSRPALVEFYAPWCGHCKTLAPIYDQLGEAFAHAGNQVIIAKVNADSHRDLGSAYGVKGFPTLKWFPKGVTRAEDVEDYRGGRDLNALAAFVRDKTGVHARIKVTKSNVLTLTTKNFYTVAQDPTQNVLVEFYASWCGHCKTLAPIYEKVATAFANEPHCRVAKIDADHEKEIGTAFDISGFPTLKFFPAGATEPMAYEGPRTEAGFVEYLNTHCKTHRTVGGGLTAAAGRTHALDTLAVEFVKDPKARQRIYEQAQQHVQGTKDKYVAYYSKIMQKVIKEGDAFLATEKARLEKITKASAMTSAKLDDFVLRQNILNVFDKDSSSVEL
ncbi:thioredoxin-like protein [Spinellus fusiger]|nr:thioredoxin-like protein [Spinellus fusiger]